MLAYAQMWNGGKNPTKQTIPQQFEHLPPKVVTEYEDMDIGIVHFDLDVANCKSKLLYIS